MIMRGLQKPATVVILLMVLLAHASGEPTDEEHRWILQQLRTKFSSFRERTQYGVIYVPPPNSRTRRMTYLPSPDFDNQRGVLYPGVLQNDNEYQHNYAVASPDYGAVVYGSVMGRKGNIHTEDLLLNLVLPRMQRWYKHQYRQNPRAIYIFTHFLPCHQCFQIIQNQVTQNPSTAVYVGYTDLYGGTGERGNVNRMMVTQNRRDQITNFLRNNGGRLFQVAVIDRLCAQRGLSHQIRKRQVSQDTCPISSKNREFIVVMDFSSGFAAVEFASITSDTNGWIGLYDKQGKRQTWQWTYGKTGGRKVFDTYINDGYNVKYFPSKKESPTITSFSWHQCGFDWEKLNKVPSSYGDTSLKVTVKDGYPLVSVKSEHPEKFSSWDWVVIQAINQINTTGKWTWQYVSKFAQSSNNEKYYLFGSRIGGKLANGFRAKYVYSHYKYHWEGDYDNATPLWTPNGCRGTKSIGNTVQAFRSEAPLGFYFPLIISCCTICNSQEENKA